MTDTGTVKHAHPPSTHVVLNVRSVDALLNLISLAIGFVDVTVANSMAAPTVTWS